MDETLVELPEKGQAAMTELSRLCMEAGRPEIPGNIRSDHLESLLERNSAKDVLKSILESEDAFAEQVGLERELPFAKVHDMLTSGAMFVRGYTKLGRPILWLNFGHCEMLWLEKPYLQVYITWMKRVAMLRRREGSVDHRIVLVIDDSTRSPLHFNVEGFGAYLGMSKRLFLSGDIAVRIFVVSPSWAFRATSYLIRTIQPSAMDERIVMVTNRQKIVDLVEIQEDVPFAFSSTGRSFRPEESFIGDIEIHFTMQPMTYRQFFNAPLQPPLSSGFASERCISTNASLFAQSSSSPPSTDLVRENQET